MIGSFSTDVAGDVNKAGVDRLDEAPQASMQLKTDRSHTIFHSGFNVMVWLGEFQRKGEVELCFLEQFYIKGMSWHKIKHGGGGDNRDHNGSIFCDIEHILNFKGPIQMPLKSSSQSLLNFATLFFPQAKSCTAWGRAWKC